MYMYKRILIFLFMLQGIQVRAQSGTVRLSLRDAEERFLACNLTLIAERYNIDIAEAQVIQAGLFENPVVSFEQNVYNRLNGKYFDIGREGEAAVEIEQLIHIAGQRNNRVRLEKINKEMAGYQFEEVLRTLRYELKTKFIDLFYIRKSLSVYDREIGYLKKLVEVYKEQNEQGNISLLEKSRIQALLFSLREERNEAANRAVTLQGDLKLLLDLHTNATFEPRFDESVIGRIDLASVSFSDLSGRMAVRPDVKIAAASVRASQANVKLQRSLAFPEISLKGTYDRAGNFINNYFAVGISVSVPVFNRNQGNIKAARLSVLQNNNREQSIRQQAENELFASYHRLEKAIGLYRSSDCELERDFEILLQGVNDNFRKRNISLLAFIDYYQTCKETCLRLYETRKNVLLAVEEINRVTGSEVFRY